jgi:hypothetical protein
MELTWLSFHRIGRTTDANFESTESAEVDATEARRVTNCRIR